MLFLFLCVVSDVEFLFFFVFSILILDKIFLACKISKFSNIKKRFFIASLLFVSIFFIYLNHYNPIDLIVW